MAIRPDPLQVRGYFGRKLLSLRQKALLPFGGQTHNFAAADLRFLDLACLRCGRAFEESEQLVLTVRKVTDSEIRCVPVHAVC